MRTWDRSRALLEQARQSLAGGVSSPFRAQFPVPLYFTGGRGSRLTDVDGNEYIDYVLGWGPSILGHAHPAMVEAIRCAAERPHQYGQQHEGEIRVAGKIHELVPCAELVAFTSSGSEAVQLACRLARAFTGRNLVLKFEGHYHGWMDSALVGYHPSPEQLGPLNGPPATLGSRGQVPNVAENTVVAPWNRLDILEEILHRRNGHIAAIMMEPVLCNSGCLLPQPGYLEGVRDLAARHGALLIFDEVITGFRMDLGGAQSFYGVTPDLATFGKAVAGGLALSVVAGRREIMQEMFGGGVAFGGTFNGNPISLAGAEAALAELARDNGAALVRANALGRQLMAGLAALACERGVPLTITGFGTAFALHFGNRTELRDYRDTLADDRDMLRRFLTAALAEGLHIIPDGRMYISAAHSERDVEEMLAAASGLWIAPARDNSVRLRIVLISTYELGHQPFGLASPAAWLRAEGHEVACADLACGPLPAGAVTDADLVAFFLPMHTATRLALKAMAKVRALNPRAFLCCYGLYAPMNAALLRELGAGAILGGEFEHGLVDLARRLAGGDTSASGTPLVSLERQRFQVPDRATLPPLSAYARLEWNGTSRIAGYTEASRGCKHLCRHCPIVPIYNGAFRVVQRDVVLEDIRRQVAAGARHITFGDPDFFNGPGHAVPIVEALHREFPDLTYDVTIKVEHLLEHRSLLPALQRTGCLWVTSAVESIDDAVLEKLAKGHTRGGFREAVQLTREAGLTLAPTFLPFTPWTTWEGYRALLQEIVALDLVEQVAPIQLAIRLLIPAGSRLLELSEIRAIAGPFDSRSLAHPWRHADPSLDELCGRLQELVKEQDRSHAPRSATFAKIWSMAWDEPLPDNFALVSRAAIPYLTEPWYC